MKTKSADLYEKKTTCLDLELEQRDLLMHRSLEQESPLAEMLQKLASANFNVKKDVSNEDKPYLIHTSRALNKTIYSNFKSCEHESTYAPLSPKLIRERLTQTSTINRTFKFE